VHCVINLALQLLHLPSSSAAIECMLSNFELVQSKLWNQLDLEKAANWSHAIDNYSERLNWTGTDCTDNDSCVKVWSVCKFCFGTKILVFIFTAWFVTVTVSRQLIVKFSQKSVNLCIHCKFCNMYVIQFLLPTLFIIAGHKVRQVMLACSLYRKSY